MIEFFNTHLSVILSITNATQNLLGYIPNLYSVFNCLVYLNFTDFGFDLTLLRSVVVHSLDFVYYLMLDANTILIDGLPGDRPESMKTKVLRRLLYQQWYNNENSSIRHIYDRRAAGYSLNARESRYLTTHGNLLNIIGYRVANNGELVESLTGARIVSNRELREGVLDHLPNN